MAFLLYQNALWHQKTSKHLSCLTLFHLQVNKDYYGYRWPSLFTWPWALRFNLSIYFILFSVTYKSRCALSTTSKRLAKVSFWYCNAGGDCKVLNATGQARLESKTSFFSSLFFFFFLINSVLNFFVLEYRCRNRIAV